MTCRTSKNIPLPTLVLDTAGPVLSVAVIGVAEGMNASFKEHVWRDMAEQLHPAVGQVLEEAKTPFTELKSICVNVGPGSFTSVRIGLAAAKAYGFALAIPVYGASGFEAVAQPFVGKGKNIGIWLEATAGEVYYQYFDQEGAPLGTPNAALPHEAFQNAPQNAAIDAIFVGNVDFSAHSFLANTQTHKIEAANPQSFTYVALENALAPLYVRALKYKKQA